MLKRMAYTCFFMLFVASTPFSSQADEAGETTALLPVAQTHLSELKQALNINACQESQWQDYVRAILSRRDAEAQLTLVKQESSAAMMERHWRDKVAETAWVGAVAAAYRKLYDRLEPAQRLVADARFAADAQASHRVSGPARASAGETLERRRVRVM